MTSVGRCPPSFQSKRKVFVVGMRVGETLKVKLLQPSGDSTMPSTLREGGPFESGFAQHGYSAFLLWSCFGE